MMLLLYFMSLLYFLNVLSFLAIANDLGPCPLLDRIVHRVIAHS